MHLVGPDTTFDPFPPEGSDDAHDRRDAYRAVGVSAFGLALAGVVELGIAALSGSVGLLGDALHNLADVSTSAAVLSGFRISRRPATPSYPYGRERAEDLAGLGVAVLIWASAVLAGVVSIRKLAEHGHTSHLGIGAAAAGVGIVANQVVARYKLRVGRRIHSATLVADARHSWLDAVSSLGAMAGLAGVALGLRWADAVAGLVVTAFIVRVGWEVTSEVGRHLMDGVAPEVLDAAERAAAEVDGIGHVHVRARWVGRSLIVEVEGFLAEHTTVGEAESLGRRVEQAVSGVLPHVRAVLWRPRAMPAA